MGFEPNNEKKILIVGKLDCIEKKNEKYLCQKFFYESCLLKFGKKGVFLLEKGLMGKFKLKDLELKGIIFPLTFGKTNNAEEYFAKYKSIIPIFEAYKYYPEYESYKTLLNTNIQGRMYSVQAAFDNWLKKNF
jgi:hypothetical protein